MAEYGRALEDIYNKSAYSCNKLGISLRMPSQL